MDRTSTAALIWAHVIVAGGLMIYAWQWQTPMQVIAGTCSIVVAAFGLYHGYRHFKA